MLAKVRKEIDRACKLKARSKLKRFPGCTPKNLPEAPTISAKRKEKIVDKRCSKFNCFRVHNCLIFRDSLVLFTRMRCFFYKFISFSGILSLFPDSLVFEISRLGFRNYFVFLRFFGILVLQIRRFIGVT